MHRPVEQNLWTVAVYPGFYFFSFSRSLPETKKLVGLVRISEVLCSSAVQEDEESRKGEEKKYEGTTTKKKEKAEDKLTNEEKRKSGKS